MKTLHLLNFLSLASLAFLFSCNKKEVAPDNPPIVRVLRTTEAQTIKNSTEFAFNVFGKLNTLKPADQNLFISPYSIAMAVAMTYNGANTTTKEGIKKALSLEGLTDEELNNAFLSLSEYLNGIDKTVTFTPANSIWYLKSLTPQGAFVETNQNYFDAKVTGLDFLGDPEGSKNTINDWVKNKTNQKIEKIVDQVSPDNVMFLINAIYFKGTWSYKFDKNMTKSGTFYLQSGSTVQKEFMRGTATTEMYSDTDKVLVDLPYGNKQFSMTLLLPQPGKTIQDLVNQLTTETFADWLEKAHSQTVNITLPKFKFEGDYTKKEFNNILSELGMDEAFTSMADFSNLLVGFNKGDLKIDKVSHKTFVQVDEEGTAAAAATSVEIVETTSSVPTSVTINRPFLYLIREKNSAAILFMGKVMNPTIER